MLFKEKNNKLIVDGIMKDGPAGLAGIKDGDLIVSIDGKKIRSYIDYRIALINKKKGDTIKITVKRKYFLFMKKKITVTVKL